MASTWQPINSDTASNSKMEIISSNIETTTIDFNIDGFHLISVSTPTGEMNLARLSDGASLLETGAPDLQKYSRSIIIPDNKMMFLNITSTKYVDYNDVLIAPSKGNLNRLINPADVEYQFGNVYEEDAFYPGNLAELGTPYILRDLRGVTVEFYPFQYNPVQNILRVYTEVQVEVKSLGDGVVNTFDNNRVGVSKYSNEFKSIYKNHFLNFDSDNRFDYLVDHGNMLVISNSAFIETMQPLVDWKNLKGIPTEMVDAAAIGGNSGAIESFVETYYYENGLTFLLLVGDIAQMPSPSVGGSSSDVSYGCISGNDFYPEVIVGRFSGSTPTQIGTQVERSIEYERYPQGGVEWYDNALGIASNQGPGFGGYTDDQFSDFLWDTVLSGFTYDSYEDIYDGSGGTLTQGINAINNGVSLINYVGHGSISSWGNGAPLSTSNVNSLTNENLLPFVITVGCNVGEFQSTNECFAESWLRATNNGEPTGAISHFGSTISQSWEPPMHGQYGMNLILTESLDNNKTRTMGGITTNGCMYMNDAQGSSGINETKYWTLFGDPSVPLRTAPPTSVNASHDDVIILGSSEFDVATGNEGDLVALSRDGELLASGYTDSFGNANITLGEAGTVPGELDLVITGFNNFPYETTVMVLSPEGPYVLVDYYYVWTDWDDMIDFGESVTLSLNLENVGSDGASNVSVNISTDDTYITITDNIAYANYIDANETILVEGLSFLVSVDVPDHHEFEIACVISANGDVWESNLTFLAHAPVIDVLSVTGDLDPGASTDLNIVLANNGSASIDDPLVEVFGDNYVMVSSYTLDPYYWDYSATWNHKDLVMSVSVSPSTPIGHIAEFTVIISESENGFSTIVNFSIPVGQITANFEAGMGSLEWELSGNADWGADNTEANSGSGSAISGAISNSQSSDISVTLDVTADGVIEFYYKVSAEYSTSGSYFYDGLEFYIDNTLQGQYQSTTSGGSPWTQVSYDVSEGEHTFKWSYVKDGGGGSTDCDNTNCADAAWIDDIVFPPAYVEGDEGMAGDLNGDEMLNVLDIIIMVNVILDDTYNPDADLNGDGTINILDVVQLVNLILGPRVDNANRVQLFDTGSIVKISANGYVGAVKMVLLHDSDFILNLTNNALVADAVTEINSTTLVIVVPETDELFSYTGNFEIVEMEAANSENMISIILPSKTSLGKAYPNPFNPSTNISFILAESGKVNLSIYNLSGQLIESLINGQMKAGSYTQSWDASMQPSGMYFLRLQAGSESFDQKLMVIK